MVLDPHGHKAIHIVSGISMFPRAMRTTDGRNSLEFIYMSRVEGPGRRVRELEEASFGNSVNVELQVLGGNSR